MKLTNGNERKIDNCMTHVFNTCVTDTSYWNFVMAQNCWNNINVRICSSIVEKTVTLWKRREWQYHTTEWEMRQNKMDATTRWWWARILAAVILSPPRWHHILILSFALLVTKNIASLSGPTHKSYLGNHRFSFFK